MAKDLRRGDLKRNELGEAVEASVHFAEEHLQAILWTLGGVFVAAVAVWGVISWQSHRLAAANAMLGDALRVVEAPVVGAGARPDDPKQASFATAAARSARAAPLFEKVVREHGSTSAGAAARLWLAERALRAGDAAEARRLWQTYLQDAPGGAMAVAAQRNLWSLDRTEGRAADVLTEIRSGLERGGQNLPADLLLWELAETQQALGSPADSTAALRRIVEEHPSSPFANEARQRLATLGGGA